MNDTISSGQFPSSLSPSTCRRLNAYALAAGAAGVSVLALGQTAEAKVVYTPAHQPILGPRGFYGIDLNHDGTIDFGITNTTNFNTDQAFSNLFVKAEAGNAVVGTFVYFAFPPNARAMKSGSQIGQSLRFFQKSAKLVSYYSGGGGQSAHGNWINVGDRYLGLAFQLNGKTHFGWARLSVKILKQGLRIQAILTGYAYETEPNTPIKAGQTSGSEDALSGPEPRPQATGALGLLAAGNAGLELWRREDPLAADVSGWTEEL